jgi:hypothetical protein
MQGAGGLCPLAKGALISQGGRANLATLHNWQCAGWSVNQQSSNAATKHAVWGGGGAGSGSRRPGSNPSKFGLPPSQYWWSTGQLCAARESAFTSAARMASPHAIAQPSTTVCPTAQPKYVDRKGTQTAPCWFAARMLSLAGCLAAQQASPRAMWRWPGQSIRCFGPRAAPTTRCVVDWLAALWFLAGNILVPMTCAGWGAQQPKCCWPPGPQHLGRLAGFCMGFAIRNAFNHGMISRPGRIVCGPQGGRQVWRLSGKRETMCRGVGPACFDQGHWTVSTGKWQKESVNGAYKAEALGAGEHCWETVYRLLTEALPPQTCNDLF